MTKVCLIRGCSAAHRARGYCNKHWQRWRSTGDPLKVKRQTRLNLKGQRFGRLQPMRETEKRGQGQIIWLCHCDCGAQAEVQAGNLRSGNTQSCGCLQKDNASNFKHGDARGSGHAVEYTTWWSMIARCKYPSVRAYPWYGGKGISVCPRWTGDDGYKNFLADMGHRPGDGWSIDRIDSDGDYEPGNCRWLLMSENVARSHSLRKRGGGGVIG